MEINQQARNVELKICNGIREFEAWRMEHLGVTIIAMNTQPFATSTPFGSSTVEIYITVVYTR